MYSENEVAYLAGIVDGEGCISIRCWRDKKKYTGYSLMLDVGNTNELLTSWIVTRFGGKVSCFHFKHPNHKPRYCWRISHGQAEGIIRLIYPYLVIKKEQASLALSFRATYKKGNTVGLSEKTIRYRKELIAMLHKLNQRGKYPGVEKIESEDVLVFRK